MAWKTFQDISVSYEAFFFNFGKILCEWFCFDSLTLLFWHNKIRNNKKKMDSEMVSVGVAENWVEWYQKCLIAIGTS